MHIEDDAVRYWVHRIRNVSESVHFSIETSYIPYNFISVEGEEIEVPNDPREIMRVRHPDMGVTCTFQYHDINKTEKQFKTIYNYFSSLSYVDDVLGLVNRELDTLHLQYGELLEFHAAYSSGKFIHADQLHRFGSKTFVQKQIQKFEKDRDALQEKVKEAKQLVLDAVTNTLQAGVNTATGYGYPLYERPDYVFATDDPVDDDYLPF